MAATTGAMIMTAETAITSTTDAEPILPQHRFDEAALEHYLKENIPDRSEEHTSELQSLMRISYAVFCLKKKKQTKHNNKYLKLTTHKYNKNKIKNKNDNK